MDIDDLAARIFSEYGDQNAYAADPVADIATMIRDAAPRWIPVMERLPDEGQIVLWRSLLTGNYRRAAYCRDSFGDLGVSLPGESHYSTNFYSHWLSLPPLPEEA